MDSSRIIGIHQTRNQLGIQSINNNNLNEAVGRLLYFQENQKREGAAVLVSPQHIITPIVNVVSPQSKEFSVKDSFVFQSSLGEYVGIKELFFEKTFQYDDWNEASIADQQYCCCAIMQLEKPIKNVRHCGIVSISDYSDFFKVHSNKFLYLPTGKNESTYVIENFDQDKYFLSFDVNQQSHINEQKIYQQFRINTQIPVFVNDIETLGGLCLVGFAQQYLQTSKFQTWILSKDNFEDIHKWLNGHNASFTVDYETTIDSSRNFKSKELKDSKNAQAHSGKVLCLFKLEKFYAASCSEDKQIKVWNWRTGKLKKIFKTDRPCKLVFGISEYLIGVEGNMMIVINWKNKRVENISTHTCEINIVRPVKNRSDKINRIVLIDVQNCIHLYKFDTKVKGFVLERELLKWDIPNDTINSCLNYSESQIIFSTQHSGNISILNWVQGREERRYETKEINKGVQSISQNQNGIVCMMIHPQKNNYILISCYSGAFGVWDTERSAIVLKIAQFQNPILTMDRQSFNQIVISDGKDYQLLQIQQVLNFSSKKYSSHHFTDINHVLHLDDEFFLTSDTSGRLRIWQLEQPYILPDGMIGTENHPVFNILQCPELNSLNNSISSSAVQEQNMQYDSFQSNQTNYQPTQHFQQYQSIQNNNYNNQTTNSNTSNRSHQNQQNNIKADSSFEQNQADQNLNDYQQNQNQDQLSLKDIQTQDNNDQEQTFSNSKFVNDSQDNIQPDEQQKQNFILGDGLQKSKYEELEYPDKTPQFNPSSFENLGNEKPQISDKGQNKVKLLNLEEAFNVKRQELEKQQQGNNGTPLQPIYSLYSQIPSIQYQSNQQNKGEQEGKLTDIQNQIIQSDRSLDSEFSLYKHNRKNSREEDHEILQPDLGDEDEDGRQLNPDEETLCLNENIQKDEQQNHQKVNEADHNNYNSVVSNASESYLAAIHSHLIQQPNTNTQTENSVQSQFKGHNESNQISNSQLSNMINVVNQKLIQINQDPQIQQQFKNNETFQQSQQKGNVMISQQEAQQLRMELENLILKMNEYKKLNDQLNLNQQLITNKLNMELEKNEKEKQEKQHLKNELNIAQEEYQKLQSNFNSYQQEKDQLLKINDSKEEEIKQLRQINNNYEKEMHQYKQQKDILEGEIRINQQNQKTETMMKENILTENQNLIKINQELSTSISALQSQIQNMTIQKHQENQKILEENSNLLKQISIMKIEKQNLCSQNENLLNNNQQLMNQYNTIAKENAQLFQEIEEFKKQNQVARKEITFYQQENIKLQQQVDSAQKDLASIKLQIDNSKFNYQNERQDFVEKVNQIVTEQANEKNLSQLTECIKNSQISVKELEQIQKNIYEKQIKNLYSQIDEQQRENQRILKQTSQIEIQNKNLIQDIDNTRKENERLKNDLRRTKESLEHWVKQYSVLLDREKLQIKNIESKEELILLLKQEIEKLNSLYQQQLQEQLNNNATINGNNNNAYEQCRKELLLDEWNSLLSLIENESMAQFSRIEQTNRKSEKISITPQQTNANQQQQIKHQFQPVQQQANYFSHQKEPKQPSQNSQQIYIKNDYQIGSLSDNKSNYHNPLSQITQNIPSQQSKHSVPSNNLSPLYSKNLFQQSIDIKQPSTPNQQKSSSNQLEQNFSQKYFQNPISPNLQTSQISSSPQSLVKSQSNVNQYQSTLKTKPQQSSNGYETPQTSSQPFSSAEKQTQKLEVDVNQQRNLSNDKKQFTNYYSYQNEAGPQKFNSNLATLQNENQKALNHNNQINIQPKNFFSAQKINKESNPQNQQQAINLSMNQQYSPNHNLNNNNNQIHYRNKSDISQANQQEMINKQKEKLQGQVQSDSQPQKEDSANEHRSKSPQAVNIQNQIQQQQIKQQYQQSLLQKNAIAQNNVSNVTNPNNLVQTEKSDRSISGLQNLKNMKKNISLTNVSSQPISTLNIATISPSSYNDKPSEFIRRQIEHQQYLQYVDTKSYESLRSLTPQPAKTNFVFQSNNIAQQEKQLNTDYATKNSQNEEALVRRDTFDPQAYKKEKLEVQIDYTKPYSSQSPIGRQQTTPITGNSNIGSMIYPNYLGDTRKQISFTPTPSVKKQKIQEALKMTYINTNSEQVQYNNIPKHVNQGAASQN